jgi:hypothetical protein
MVLSYPELPADALAGTTVARTSICRTFSDCTTAPRHGLRSGCYPLDDFYKQLEPEASRVKAIKGGGLPDHGIPARRAAPGPRGHVTP